MFIGHQQGDYSAHQTVTDVDHASGVLDGDELEKAPWRELWTQRLSKFDLPWCWWLFGA